MPPVGCQQNIRDAGTSSNLMTFQGDSLAQNNKHIIRIYFNNYNSLEASSLITDRVQHSYYKKTEKFNGSPRSTSNLELILTKMKKWQVNITCLAESCVAWEQATPLEIVRKITRYMDRTMRVNTSTSISQSVSHTNPVARLVSLTITGADESFTEERTHTPWEDGITSQSGENKSRD